MKALRNLNPVCRLFGIASLYLFGACSASAVIVVDVSEINGDVVATASGFADLSDLIDNGSTSLVGTLGPAGGYIAVGSGAGTKFVTFPLIDGPANFGSGNFQAASSYTGGSVVLDFDSNYLVLPSGYSSNAPINSTATWNNTTIAGLNMTPGTYEWTWGSGGQGEKFVLNIGVIPEPATYAALLGFVALGLVVIRRRRK